MLLNLLEGTTENNNGTGTIIILVVLVVLIVAFMIWQNVQNKKKAKEAEEAISKLKKGDKIKTIGGICGYLVEMNEEENTFVLETGTESKKSYIKFDKQAIYQTASVGEEPASVAVKEENKEEVKTEEAQPVEEKPKKKRTKKATSKPKAEEGKEETAEEKPE